MPTLLAMACRALTLALAGSLGLGVSATLGGCSLLLDFDKEIRGGDGGTTTDAAGPTDADVTPDATTAANCDVLEPNETLNEAMPIAAMTIEAALCPGADLDFYSFNLPDNSDLTITLNFLNASDPGDLNLRLYNAGGTIVSAATGTGTSDQIAHSPGLGNALPGGTYRIEVFAASPPVTKDYSLTLQHALLQ